MEGGLHITTKQLVRDSFTSKISKSGSMLRMEEHCWIEQTFAKNVWHKPECVQMTALINVIPLLSVSKVNFSLCIMPSNKN